MYRLPTEAQWEYACRGGASSYNPFHFGDTLTSKQANFDNDLDKTSPVGCYDPNGFGLHNMTGNTWEWCHDWFASAWQQRPLSAWDSGRKRRRKN